MTVARLPAVFANPGFPALWVSLSLSGLATSISQLALSWTILELTSSPLGVGLTFAVRVAPSLLLGIPLGAFSDRVDRRRLIRSMNLAAAAAGAALAGLAYADDLGVPIILLFSFLFGVIDTARTPALQAYVFDLVGADRATSGLAMANLGAMLFVSVGAVVGGFLIAQGGLGVGFVVAAIASLTAAVVIGRSSVVGRAPHEGPTPSARRALTLLGRNRDVRWILAIVVAGEIFGFSSMALTPTFAKDVLAVGAAGLGVLVAGRSAGAVVGLIGLVRVSMPTRTGRALLGRTVIFGAALIVFALSAIFPLSLVAMFVIGMAAAAVDTLAQALLQHATDDHERGASMGVWVFGIGFGPIGFIGIGAIASVYGAPAAQFGFGLLLIGVSVVFALVGPLRRLR